MRMFPSHIWYLMLASEVRPNNGKIDEPRATGKKRRARQMFPTSPSLNDALSNLASHLPKAQNHTTKHKINFLTSAVNLNFWHDSFKIHLKSIHHRFFLYWYCIYVKSKQPNFRHKNNINIKKLMIRIEDQSLREQIFVVNLLWNLTLFHGSLPQIVVWFC